jgi:hypothetical protein
MSEQTPSPEAPQPQKPDHAADNARRRPGRPPTHAESWTKVTVVLFDRQIAYLDRIVATIRSRTGAPISRAQLIRALVDAAAEANVDLSAGATEKELRTTLVSRFLSGTQ